MRIRLCGSAFSYEAEKKSIENLSLFHVHQMPGVIDDFQMRIRNAALNEDGIVRVSDFVFTAGNN